MRGRIHKIVVVVVVVSTLNFCLSKLEEGKVRCENVFGCTMGSPVFQFNTFVQRFASCCCYCCCRCFYCCCCCCCYCFCRCCCLEQKSIPRALSIMTKLNTCKYHTRRSSLLEEHTVQFALVQSAVAKVPVLPLFPRYNREKR